MLAAKLTDDLLIVGLLDKLTEFAKQFLTRFRIEKAQVYKKVIFNDCEISKSPSGHIMMSMHN